MEWYSIVMRRWNISAESAYVYLKVMKPKSLSQFGEMLTQLQILLLGNSTNIWMKP